MDNVKEPKFLIQGKEVSMPFGVGGDDASQSEYARKVVKEVGDSPNRDAIYKMLQSDILKKKEEWLNRQLKEEMYKKEMYNRGLPPMDVIAMLGQMYGKK